MGCAAGQLGQATVAPHRVALAERPIDGLQPSLQLGTWIHESVSVMPRYEAFGRGLISLADLVYFGLMITFFIWMNQLTLARSKQ